MNVLPDAWEILAAVLPRATNPKALVFESEHDTVDQVLPVFDRLEELLASQGA